MMPCMDWHYQSSPKQPQSSMASRQFLVVVCVVKIRIAVVCSMLIVCMVEIPIQPPENKIIICI